MRCYNNIYFINILEYFTKELGNDTWHHKEETEEKGKKIFKLQYSLFTMLKKPLSMALLSAITVRIYLFSPK